MVLLATFKALLYRYTNQDDIVVGSPIANRKWLEVEPLIGFFANILVLRTNLSNNPTFRELLSRVRQVTLEAYTHQDLPFEQLVSELQPGRDLSGHTPLFQVSFALQNAPMRSHELPELTVSPMQVSTQTAKFDLWLSMAETATGINAILEYNTDLFKDVSITRMIGHFQTLIQGIIADSDQAISDLPLLTDSELQQVLQRARTKSGVVQRRRCA
jgi:non-ribosomal peptide synthetase component F